MASSSSWPRGSFLMLDGGGMVSGVDGNAMDGGTYGTASSSDSSFLIFSFLTRLAGVSSMSKSSSSSSWKSDLVAGWEAMNALTTAELVLAFLLADAGVFFAPEPGAARLRPPGVLG